MQRLIFFLLLLPPSIGLGESPSLRTNQIPFIENSILKITGPIDSHIYDALAYMGKDLETVRYVELNSFGGSSQWAMEIARKIKDLNLNTRVTSGHVCASACVYLFSAGAQRVAAPDVWFGIHGARLGAGFLMELQSYCFDQNIEGQLQFNKDKENCSPIIDKWYEMAMNSTLESFALMESNGVSTNLRLDYFNMDVDPNWPLQGNILQVEDWTLEALEALNYNLVTEILE